MPLHRFDEPLGGHLLLRVHDTTARRAFFAERHDPMLAIAWNRGEAQTMWVDEVPITLPAGHLVTLVVSQSFRFERPAEIALWQFNRTFYCIVDHDHEVACVGLLFYGSHGVMVLDPGHDGQRRLGALLAVFLDEFDTRDHMQGDMLRMLLKRLILLCTRLARDVTGADRLSEPQVEVVRRFNLLVEQHYRTLHRVSDYARLLNKSPKTLANLFAQYQQRSPLSIIRSRIALEGQRLLLYTDRSAKQIAADLGFDSPATFSRFFKAETGEGAAHFRAAGRQRMAA